MVIRSIEKTIGLNEVVRAIKRPIEPVIEKAYLTGYSEKLGPLIVNICKM